MERTNSSPWSSWRDATSPKSWKVGRLASGGGARIVRQVCHALEAAHAENVIHRDLKPQNIMLDSAGKVLVMDFGLARSVEMSGLTRTGAVLGTPAYMSPEQARGQALDHRSDLFSLGRYFLPVADRRAAVSGRYDVGHAARSGRRNQLLLSQRCPRSAAGAE